MSLVLAARSMGCRCRQRELSGNRARHESLVSMNFNVKNFIFLLDDLGIIYNSALPVGKISESGLRSTLGNRVYPKGAKVQTLPLR